jgi:hypothetical protein
MEVFVHHIYEYQKGLRNLILHTDKLENKEVLEKKLIKREIPYLIQEIGKGAINIFFGHEFCIDVVKKINKVKLNKYTPEEDFMLGTMLGYGRLQQCARYLKRKDNIGELDDLIG